MQGVFFILFVFGVITLPTAIWSVVKHYWCTHHWERNKYRSKLSFDGREYRWCEKCKAECDYADRQWEKL